MSTSWLAELLNNIDWPRLNADMWDHATGRRMMPTDYKIPAKEQPVQPKPIRPSTVEALPQDADEAALAAIRQRVEDRRQARSETGNREQLDAESLPQRASEADLANAALRAVEDVLDELDASHDPKTLNLRPGSTAARVADTLAGFIDARDAFAERAAELRERITRAKTIQPRMRAFWFRPSRDERNQDIGYNLAVDEYRRALLPPAEGPE